MNNSLADETTHLAIPGTIIQGKGSASGGRFQGERAGSLISQIDWICHHFPQYGNIFEGAFVGTINVIPAQPVPLVQFDYIFRNVQWFQDIPSFMEDIFLRRCKIAVNDMVYNAFIYHPSGAIHGNGKNYIEIIAGKIKGLQHNAPCTILLDIVPVLNCIECHPMMRPERKQKLQTELLAAEEKIAVLLQRDDVKQSIKESEERWKRQGNLH